MTNNLQLLTPNEVLFENVCIVDETMLQGNVLLFYIDYLKRWLGLLDVDCNKTLSILQEFCIKGATQQVAHNWPEI